MRAQRYHSVGLAILSAALVLLSGSNVVATSSSSAPSMECTDTSISDGDCDMSNNTEECGRLEGSNSRKRSNSQKLRTNSFIGP